MSDGILVTDITSHNVRGRRHAEITLAVGNPDLTDCLGPMDMMAMERTETVPIREYRAANGRRVFIGLSRSVGEALGIPLEAWEAMDKALDRANKNIATLNRDNASMDKAIGELSAKLVRVDRATFWTRLRWLFCGVDRKLSL